MDHEEGRVRSVRGQGKEKLKQKVKQKLKRVKRFETPLAEIEFLHPAPEGRPAYPQQYSGFLLVAPGFGQGSLDMFFVSGIPLKGSQGIFGLFTWFFRVDRRQVAVEYDRAFDEDKGILQSPGQFTYISGPVIGREDLHHFWIHSPDFFLIPFIQIF